MEENTAFSPTSPLTLHTQPTLPRHTDYQSQSNQQYSQKSLEILSFILFHFSLFIKTGGLLRLSTEHRWAALSSGFKI